MPNVTNDPAIRYTAGVILVLAFVAAVAIIVHGYWLDPNYQIPTTISWIVGAGISGALTLLGVHLGAQSTNDTTISANDQTRLTAQQSAQATTQAITNGVSHVAAAVSPDSSKGV